MSASFRGRAVRPVVLLLALALGGTAWAEAARAQVTLVDLEVVESPALDGRSFGDVGMYEKLRGVAHGAVDPDDSRHAGIVNLDRAPKSPRDRIEYATTVEIHRPVDMARWNGAIYHTVPNRGRPGAAPDALLERGFALVRVGWQGDLRQTDTNIAASLPVARNPDGSPIVATAMEEFVFDDHDPVSEDDLTYPAASLDPAHATLTVRRTQNAPRLTPDDLSWSWVDSSRIRIRRPEGFSGGAIYELVYRARDPIVMGLGFAVMRDVVSFLRYEETDGAGNPNPLVAPGSGLATTALSIGISQSGRYLRDMLHQGFNEDVEGRIVFDGIHPDIAGSRKTFTNYAFSQPGRWQKQHEDHLYPGDQFPFTYTTLRDPMSGRTDGLLERCRASDTCPRIIHTDGEAEIWQARASLVVTDPQGGDIELPENVRAYLVAGTGHGGGAGVHVSNPGPGICQNSRNPMALSQIRTALTVALAEWVMEGKEPPASRFPRMAGSGATEGAPGPGLVPAAELDFPAIPGVEYTGSYNPLHRMDYGSIPPERGEAYTVLVGRVDGDGNMVDGILHPNLAVPIGTYTGWNLRREGFAEDAQCGGAGSFVPFAETRSERLAAGDPRPSLQERYAGHDAYVDAVARAADRLVEERLLLPRDAEEIVRLARESDVGRSQVAVERARAIHERVVTLDTHTDIDPEDFFPGPPNYVTGLDDTQVDLPSMEEGGLDAVFFSLYQGQEQAFDADAYSRAFQTALDKVAAVRRLTSVLAPDRIGLARTAEDVRRIAGDGRLVALMGMENGYALGEDVDNLETFADLGVRYLSLAHNGHNQLSDSHTGEESGEWRWNGLSPLGRRMVAEANRLGVVLDVSHPSKQANLETMELSRAPVMASHSSVRALADHSRNMDDELLRALADNGGVIQIVAFDSYLVPEGTGLATVSDLVDHVDYVVDLIGIDHVGISSDFDGGGGIEGWDDASETFNVTLELVRRGYSEAEIAQIWSGNLLRVMAEAERVAEGL